MMHDWGFGFGFMMGPLGMLVIAALIVIPVWRICEKARFSGMLALLIFVPLVNIIFLYWLAFTKWPSQKPAGVNGA
jgi:hypothetical protein